MGFKNLEKPTNIGGDATEPDVADDGQVELMFADLTQPSGENLGDQPDVEPGAHLEDGQEKTRDSPSILDNML